MEADGPVAPTLCIAPYSKLRQLLSDPITSVGFDLHPSLCATPHN